MLHNYPHIILKGRPMVWMMQFKYEDIYNLVSVETAYADNRNTETNGTKAVMMDDDKPIFNYYLSLAISDLTGLLARRLDPTMKIHTEDGQEITNEGIVEDKESVTYYLVMDENHESHLINSLYRYCTDFMVQRVLEQWNKVQGLADNPKKEIIKVLEFRRKPVRRPIRNFL